MPTVSVYWTVEQYGLKEKHKTLLHGTKQGGLEVKETKAERSSDAYHYKN
jgi:hypothetical protein